MVSDKQAALTRGRVGPATAMLQPFKPLPILGGNQMTEGIRRFAANTANGNQQTASTSATAPPAINGWKPGVNGQHVYMPGQGPVTGQVAKAASFGKTAAQLFKQARRGGGCSKSRSTEGS